MGEVGAFLRIARAPTPQRDPRARVADYREVYAPAPADVAREQGARCMECGVPFCHEGCPLGNRIPEFNDLVYRDDWRTAIRQLHATNDFPEFTGRICPAPCEPACVLSINDDPVAIKQIELSIVERAWAEGFIRPRPPAVRTGRRVAVVGSGPAGLAAAAQLNECGHAIEVFERDEAPGGLLRFGVPDFKLEKWVIDRRTSLLEAEGVVFRCGVDVGGEHDVLRLAAEFDAVVLAIGSRVPRDLPVPGRDLAGVHFAMDYLYGRNRWVAAQSRRFVRVSAVAPISAAGRHVVVVGGGDTAMDCIANAHREHPLHVALLDIYPAPSSRYARDAMPWPAAPKRLVSTYALDEGGERLATRTATELVGSGGRVVTVRGVAVGPPPGFDVIAGSEFELPADLVLVAIGFAHVEHSGAVGALGLDLDARGNVKAPVHATSRPGVFVAGDARIGQSLVVTAIAEGRRCARMVDRFLGAS